MRSSRRPLWALALALVVGITLATSAVSDRAGAAPNGARADDNSRRDPTGLMADALQVASGVNWVHSVATVRLNSVTQTIVSDLGRGIGRETITIESARANVRLLDGTVYLRANATALVALFHVPARVVPKVAGRWVEITSPSPLYFSLATELGYGSLLSRFRLRGVLTSTGQTARDGIDVVGITGAAFGTPDTVVTVYLPASGRPLPTEATATIHGAEADLHFTRWGQRFSVTRPPHPLPASALHGSAVTA